MRDGMQVMDSDLHVMEGAAAFEAHFDPKYRAEMPEYLGLAANDMPHWSVAGQVIPPWALDPAVEGPQRYLHEPSEDLYRPIRERDFDAASTLEAMDAEGLDVAVVYRTFAHMVVSVDGLEPGLATACCAAFNDWLTDYCATDAGRLKPAAIVTLHDPELAAAEARRAVEDKGHVAIVVLPMPVNGRYVNARECDAIWKEAVRLDVPVAFHGTSGAASLDYVANRFRGHPNFRTLNHASSFPLEMMLAMGAMLAGGVCERFPSLRVGFLEGNCGWLPWWLDRLDDQWKKYGGGEAIKLSALPSELFKRQGFIATDVDEALLSTVIDHVGDDNIVMSIDYPHTDGPYPNGITEFLGLPGVGRESKKKIMWDNCVRFYGFEPGSPAAA